MTMAQAECARVQDLIVGLNEEVATTEEQHRMLMDQLQQMTKPQPPALGSAPPSSSVHTDGDQQRQQQQQQQCELECDLEAKLLQCEQHSVALQVRCRSCWSVLPVGLAGRSCRSCRFVCLSVCLSVGRSSLPVFYIISLELSE